jgi:hypothetical protein
MDQTDTSFEIQRGLVSVETGPMQLALLPPMPNPAAVRLRLAFTLPRSESVRLTVLDVTGREVATLVDGVQAPGRHEFLWQGGGSRSAAPVGGVERVRRFVLAP